MVTWSPYLRDIKCWSYTKGRKPKEILHDEDLARKPTKLKQFVNERWHLVTFGAMARLLQQVRWKLRVSESHKSLLFNGGANSFCVDGSIYSPNNFKKCPNGQKSYKSIQIWQIFIFFHHSNLFDLIWKIYFPSLCEQWPLVLAVGDSFLIF